MPKTSPLITLVATLILYASFVEATQPDQIIELFRHGARGIVNGYDSSWPLDQWGMLTPVGMRQQYILGRVLAEKYSSLIGKAYDYNQIYMLSDTTPRCVQSAETHLYGMYIGSGPSLKDNYPPELAIPPFEDARVKAIAHTLPDSEALPHNVVPDVVNIVDTNNAIIFQGDSGIYCPNVIIWDSENAYDTLSQQAWEIFGETITNVNKYLDESEQLASADDINSFGDTFLCDIADNRTLPGGIQDPELIRNMTHAFTWFTYHIWYGQQVQKEVRSYNPITAMLKQLEAFREGETYNSVAMFSGHDGNILAILAAFGVVNEDCLFANFFSDAQNGTIPYPNCYFPFFASNIVIELYNSTDTPYIKFYYNNALIPICNGQSTCSYDDFVTFAKNATGNLTSETYSETCGATNVAFDGSIVELFGENPSYNKLSKTLFESIFFKIEKIFAESEVLAITVLACLCFALIFKIVYDKKRYHQIVKSLRDERKLYTEINDVGHY